MPHLTFSLEEEGRTSACIGEVVTYTCRVTNSPYLQWTVESFHHLDDHSILFTDWDSVGFTQSEKDGLFNATLVGKNEGDWDLISNLSIRVDSSLQNKSIQCSDGFLYAHKAPRALLPIAGMIIYVNPNH